MKRYLIILSILSIVLTSCYREPFADALITPLPAYVGEDVSFVNYSSNTNYVEWDFGDGYISDQFSPVHYYTDPGFYDATLKAFGEKKGVDVITYVIEVWGSEVTIEVKDVDYDTYIPGARVQLYPTLADWDNITNMVVEGYTNNYGEVTFSNLSYQYYYVDAWVDDFYNNWELGGIDAGWIETQMLAGNYINTFIAYIAPVTAKKSGTAVRGISRENVDSNLKSARPVKENKTSVKKR